MEYTLKSADPAKIDCDCLVVFAFKDNLSPEAKKLDSQLEGALTTLLSQSGLDKHNSGSTTLYQCKDLSTKQVMLVQMGEKSSLTIAKLTTKLTTVINKIKSKPASSVLLCLASGRPGGVDVMSYFQLVARIIENTSYRYDTTKSKKNKNSTLTDILIHTGINKHLMPARRALKLGLAISHGESLSKELANLPANICTPTYLAQQAEDLGKQHNLNVKVLDEKQMEKLGMGSLLSVSAGSDEPAKMIIMEYKGDKKGSAPVTLVGKGLTFDSGGISIKPAASMDEMKYDMCGGASVFGAMRAVAEMELPINVIGVVPSSENLINGKANKPGDVVTSMSKQTIEILNTDAEGRLILCDALTYVERYEPAFVVDIATLTGAVIIALGAKATGLMTNDQKLANAIAKTGDQCGDRVWQLPIWDDYQSQLDTNFADIANVGGRAAGSITAACFLSRFTKKYRWAHLDIAGTAWLGGAKKGATGRPVPLLCQLLINHNQKPL